MEFSVSISAECQRIPRARLDRCELLELRIGTFSAVVCKFIQAFGIHFALVIHATETHTFGATEFSNRHHPNTP
jgi:hypothetical protein